MKPWSKFEIAALQAMYADRPTADLARQLGRPARHISAKASYLGLRKNADVAKAAKAKCLFKPGQTSWNKGLKGVCGTSPNSRATQFKPGHKNDNEMPIGSYRVARDGYLEYKFAQVTGYYYLRWIPVHRKVWIEANGPVPKGHAVAFRGERTTVLEEITLDRLELVTQAEMMRRNTLWTRYPKPVADLVLLRGALTKQINRAADRQADTASNARQGQGATHE